MLFSSIPFLYYFLPLVLVCYFCVPFRWKNFILLFFSLIFYSWGEPRYIFLMVLSILLGYIEGILIERKKHSRLILAGACCIHLGLLMYFKYIDFLIGNLNAIGLSIPLFHIALPIGISFYTFELSHRCVSKRLYGADKSDFFWSICVDVPAVDRRTDRAVQRHCSTA